jgi:hypothetical protein
MEGGGLHLERPGGGGESDVCRSSTELLPSSRLKTIEGVSWAGLLGWVLGRLGLWPDGLRPGKWFTSFFLLLFFSLFSVFCFAITNASLLFYFAGFELAIYL